MLGQCSVVNGQLGMYVSVNILIFLHIVQYAIIVDQNYPLRWPKTSSGGQNDDFRPLTSTLGGRGMGCRDKYVTS